MRKLEMTVWAVLVSGSSRGEGIFSHAFAWGSSLQAFALDFLCPDRLLITVLTKSSANVEEATFIILL